MRGTLSGVRRSMRRPISPATTPRDHHLKGGSTMPESYGVQLAVSVISSVGLLVLIGLILYLLFARSPGMSLILIGVMMAIVASVQATGIGVAAGPNAAGVVVAAGVGAAHLTKMAILVALIGAVMTGTSRPAAPAVGLTEGGPTHVA
jgi:hypothetical protein